MRKLSFEENLRHRLRDLSRRARRDSSSRSTEGMLFLAAGVIAGVAAGVLLAQKYGGVSAVADRVRERVRRKKRSDAHDQFEGHDALDHDYNDDDELYDDLDGPLSPTEELEERVLDAYHNDPVLCERAIDIGALDVGIIELTGWVHSAAESKHAVTIARGTPGVATVVNRLAVRDEETTADERAERYEKGDPSLNHGNWESSTAPREAPPGDAPRGD